MSVRQINPEIDAVTPCEAFAIFPCADCTKPIEPPELVVEVIWGFLSNARDPDGLQFYHEGCFLKHVPKELLQPEAQMELFQ